MNLKFFLIFLFLIISFSVFSETKYIFSEHPRILATKADFERAAVGVKNDPVLKQWYEKIKKEADKYYKDSPVKYELRDGIRLLSVSREILKKIFIFSFVYNIEKDQKYLDRAWLELENACNFPDWHKVHFLDTAEMTHAMAVGYDWLYYSLTKEQKDIIRKAIIEKGINEYLKSYNAKNKWNKWENNWNFVCNGGIGIGTLAIADEESSYFYKLLPLITESLPFALKQYAPDGAWNESPGYWDYGTYYLVYFIRSLKLSIGTDLDLYKTPGLEKTGDFAMYMSGPGRYSFGFGDGSSNGWVSNPLLWLLAEEYKKPEYAIARRLEADGRATVLDILWYDPKTANKSYNDIKQPLDAMFRRVEVATFRSSWIDHDAVFAGIKGDGFDDRNHTNLDNGTFFIGAFGDVWAIELGADNYNMPAYFSMNPQKTPNRWIYYRMRAEGQNTLVINPDEGPDQIIEANSKIINFQSKDDYGLAVIDMSNIYTDGKNIFRGIKLFDHRSKILLQDEIHLVMPGEIRWFMHTKADIKLEDGGKTAVLSMSKNKNRMLIKLLSPDKDELKFEIMDAVPLSSSPNPSEQNENKGIKKLVIHGKLKKDLVIPVLFIPQKEGDFNNIENPVIIPLKDWK
jgi:hypothetical protein